MKAREIIFSRAIYHGAFLGIFRGGLRERQRERESEINREREKEKEKEKERTKARGNIFLNNRAKMKNPPTIHERAV